MSFWMREATLQIGSKVYQMDDLYFEFEVPFEDSDTLQSATFKAYNLAESTRPSSWGRSPPVPTSTTKRTG